MFLGGDEITRQIAVGHQNDADQSGFFYASKEFEIGRIGGIGLLRTQSASCIVH